uniref:PHD-type domain-containing protein n=1 Tax=Amazona collaria TaxID=241587 RepID=A0A8B9F5R8_9PSIT
PVLQGVPNQEPQMRRVIGQTNTLRHSRLLVCGFCKRADCDPEVLGQLCRHDGLCVHENCLYHASGLYQRGADEEGFYGFLFPDIQEALKRVAHKSCSLEIGPGASISCGARRCPRTFHYPCGSERGCVSQFFGERAGAEASPPSAGPSAGSTGRC